MSDVFDFTGEQKKAIEHEKGHLRIIACAGSGKTEIVSQRIARLIQKGINPKNIVAFTYTEKAADELKSRIRGILDEKCPERADFGEMYVGTIHSFCFYILKELEPSYKSYDVLDEAKRVAYIAKYRNFNRLKLWPLMYTGKTEKLKYYTIIDRFIYSADITMMEDIDPDKLTNEHFKHAYTEYRKMLEEDKYLDFSSMIHTLIHLLRSNEEKLKKFNEHVKHLIVDEYQDVNKIQEELIELISLGAESVCVVGDDDQCIYQWRGSDVDYIVDFDKKYSKYKVIDAKLDINFRSTEAIVHTAREFIKNNKKRLTKNMISGPNLKRIYEPGDIIHQHFGSENEEFNFIIDKINELKGTDFLDKKNRSFSLSLGDFAVLVRANDDASRIIPYFEQRGIDCIAYSGNSIFETNEVILSMDCISYVFDCGGYTTFNQTPTADTIRLQYERVFDKKRFPESNSEEFMNKIEKIKKLIEEIKNKSPKDYLGELGLQAVYHGILNAMGAELFDFGEVYNYNLAVLSRAISDYESVWIRLRAEEVKYFFNFVYAYGKSHYVEMQHNDPALINAVKILTIHKSKGLGFPVVFVPGLVKKRPQNPVSSFVDENLYAVVRYNGAVEDERRTFYTAVTRSEKYLFLTGSIKRVTAQKNYEPHKFIEEFDKKFIIGNTSLKRTKTGYPPKLNKNAVYPTSFSELTTYDRCPQDFRLRHVFGYNAGVPAAFGYGTNIHNILNVIHKKYIDQRKIPDNKEIDRLFEIMFHLRYATKKIEKNMMGAGKGIVKNYVGLHKDQFKYILETEKKFEFVINEAIISGQIDLLKKIDDSGKVTEVEIIDFKTESDKGDDIYKLDHIKQLRFYAIACLKSLGLNPKKACIHHLDKSGGKKEYVDISPEHLSGTREDIGKNVRCILDKKFPPKPSKICVGCDYGSICPYKNAH